MGKRKREGRRELHNDKHHDVHTPTNIRVITPKNMRWEGHVARTGQNRDEKPPLENLSERAKWKDYTKMDLKETPMVGVNGIHLAKYSHKWWVNENTTINLRAPENVRDFLIANLLLS